jgi:hypothetical protein
VILAAYVYQPVLYFAVYLPFIVPRLPGWTHIPLPIHVAVIGGYLAVLLVAGRSLDHRRIALHALGIEASNGVFTFLMARLQMPAFLKSYEAYDNPWTAAAVLWEVSEIVGVVLATMAVLEAGRAMGRVMRARRSAA